MPETPFERAIERLQALYDRSHYAEVGKALEDLREVRHIADAFVGMDAAGLDGFWVCDLCGQPLAPGSVCNSGIHVGPAWGRKGKPILTPDLAAKHRRHGLYIDGKHVDYQGETIRTNGALELEPRVRLGPDQVAELYFQGFFHHRFVSVGGYATDPVVLLRMPS